MVSIASPFRLLVSAHEDDYRANLQFCCDHYRSVSEVCRRLKVNRQQFNRYLAGTAAPSRHNHRRISDSFGLEEHELLMPHEAFAATFAQRARREDARLQPSTATPPFSATRRGRVRGTFTLMPASTSSISFPISAMGASSANSLIGTTTAIRLYLR